MEFQILQIARIPDERVIELLEQNVIGTPGESMLYQHRNIRAKLATLGNAYFARAFIWDDLPDQTRHLS